MDRSEQNCADLSAMAEKFDQDQLVNMTVSLSAMLDSTLRLLEEKSRHEPVFGAARCEPRDILAQMAQVRTELNILGPMFRGQADLGAVDEIMRDFLGEDEGEYGSSEEAQR